MTALADYLENALLGHVLQAATYTPPTTVYLALFTSPTTDAGGGTEVSGGSYARQAVTFGAPSGGAASNSAVIAFANLPTGVITHCAIMDALTAGYMLFHGPLANQRSVVLGDSITFAIGALTASLA